MGTWEDRIGDLIDIGVDFRDRSVLDVGCNMGIVAYELSKKKPKAIHGLDAYKPAVRVARRVFMGVPVKHRFDIVDICDEPKLRRCLYPSYDIGLLLSVWQHLRNRNGAEAADRAAVEIAGRCRQSFVARIPSELAVTFGEILAPSASARPADRARRARARAEYLPRVRTVPRRGGASGGVTPIARSRRASITARDRSGPG